MNNVLSPELLRIGKCSYRLPILENPEHQPVIENTHVPYNEDYDDDMFACGLETDNAAENMETLKNGRLRLEVLVPKLFWGRLIGTRGAVKKRLEQETNTVIYIPRPTQNGPIAIEGDNRKNVLLAKSHVESIVFAARQKTPSTHFVSIPVSSDEIKNNFNKFKEAALKLCPDIPEKAFTRCEKLHFTLCVMVLLDDNERKLACELMRTFQPMFIEKLSGVQAEISRLCTFQEDSSKGKVLFAKLNDSHLQDVANETTKQFYEAGLIKDRDYKLPVHLHFTLINSSNVRDDEVDDDGFPIPSKVFTPWQTFDFRPLFQEMGEFCFGKFSVQTVQLNQMKSETETGYYVSSQTIQIPH